MKKFKLQLAAPASYAGLKADIEKIGKQEADPLYIQVTGISADLEQLQQWAANGGQQEVDFLLLFDITAQRINQQKAKTELLELLKEIRLNSACKIVGIFAKEKETDDTFLDFVNELMKIELHDFYFRDEFTMEDIRFWLLDNKKTLKDNGQYLKANLQTPVKIVRVPARLEADEETQGATEQLQDNQMTKSGGDTTSLQKELVNLQEENSQVQEQISVLQQSWEEERQKLLQQSQQEKEKLLQKSKQEKEELLRHLKEKEEAEQKTEERKESSLPPFMGGIFIGVMNLSHGAGSTMTAVKLANLLSAFGKAVVIAFDEKEDLFYADKKSKADYIVPSIGRKKEELVKALQLGYSFILLDFGTLLDISPSGQINASYLVDRQEDIQEFLRCQYKIVLSFTESWHIGKLQYFQQNQSLFDLEHFLFVLSGEYPAEIRSLKFQICHRNSDDLIKTLGNQMGLQTNQWKRRGK